MVANPAGSPMRLRSTARFLRHARRQPALAAALCCLIGVQGAALPVLAQAQAAEQIAPGRLLIMPRAGLSDVDFERVLRPHGGKARRIGQSALHIVDLPPNVSERAVHALLQRHSQLKFTELDRRVSRGFAPNDPYAGSQWHLDKITAPLAWDTAQGNGVTIAILDSGVAANHPDLAGHLVPGWNFYDNNSDTSDVHGHGTAVAGAAAAITNNGMGVSGVAGMARIMPVRIADANAYAYWSTVAQGLTYAADNGARVANISYVGVAGSSAVQSAAQYMKNKGGLVLVCAGNNGIDENITPTTTMIPVSATDTGDQKTSWSSFGSFVAMSAPGAGIWTTSRSGGYEAWSGTSFASPVTAGVVAAMMSANPALPATQVESLLFSTATDLGAAGRDPLYGHGRVNASAAVAAAANAPAADATAPTVAISSPGASSTVTGLVPVDVAAADNVGVARVELRVNGGLVATDSAAPFQFSWDSSKVSNGMANITATAFDAAGNGKVSGSVSVNVANAVVVDVTPPVVAITSPASGGISGTVRITTAASDNAGTAGITQSLYIDGALVSSASGASLSYSWNTRKVAAGKHTLTAVARDASGNNSSASLQVTR